MKRSLEKELMDLPGNPLGLLEGDLRNLRIINRTLGAARGVLCCLRFIVRRDHLRSFSLLDVGAGSGDIPISIVHWARREGISAKVVALEPHPVTARVARRLTADFPEIFVVEGNGFCPPFSPGAFDFVFASQMLHHFAEEEIAALLRGWVQLARKAVLVSDLIRHPMAYYGIRLMTRLFTRNVMTLNDAPLSVRRAFTMEEWSGMFRRAAIGEFRIQPIFPFRLFAFFPLSHLTTKRVPTMPRSS